jgi:hypothetical protein
MEGNINKYLKKQDVIAEQLAQPLLSGENARLLLPNAEDRRYLRSGNSNTPIYNTPIPVETVLLPQPVSKLDQLKEYFINLKNNITQSENRPIAIPERELTPEEELKINSQGGQLRILNKTKPWGPIYQ